jgi:hypothetical protein
LRLIQPQRQILWRHRGNFVERTNGRFTILGIGRERVAQLLISGPNIETKQAWVRTRRAEKVSVPLQWGMDTDPNHMYEVTIDLHPTFQPAEFTHVAGPSTLVVGRSSAPPAMLCVRPSGMRWTP